MDYLSKNGNKEEKRISSNLEDYIFSPKYGAIWKSSEYRSWIRNTYDCLTCGCELVNEREGFETHHHLHAGGKRPRDFLLVPLCLKCHNEFHANEVGFKRKYLIPNDDFLTRKALIAFVNYMCSKYSEDQVLNLLALVSIHNEE